MLICQVVAGLCHPSAMLDTVADARTLPASTSIDPAVLEAEKEELFFRGWHYVCHAGRVAEAGQYVTTSIFDQKIFVVRGPDGDLRAFYNVCPHRGHRLVDGSGSKSRIACPYHAWTYDLEGKLLRARGDGCDGGFSQSSICLSSVRVDRILDFVFINLDPQASRRWRNMHQGSPRASQQPFRTWTTTGRATMSITSAAPIGAIGK